MFLHEIQLKKVLYHLCLRKNLSKDIMFHIYNSIMNEKQKLENEIRLFYKNIYLFKIFDYRELTMISLPACLLEYDMSEKDKQHDSIFPSLKTDIFSLKLPDNRNIEWAINKYIDKDYIFWPDNHNSINEFQKKTIQRNNLLIDIKIMGEDEYLIAKKYDDDNHDSFEIIPVDMKLKLKYLNNEPRDEIVFDYNNYLEWKDSHYHDEWRLFIDMHGQGTFL